MSSPLSLRSPPVQAGRGALRVEQVAERQVHGPHGAPLLEHGAQHQGVGPQAVRDDQVSPPTRIFHTRWEVSFLEIDIYISKSVRLLEGTVYCGR